MGHPLLLPGAHGRPLRRRPLQRVLPRCLLPVPPQQPSRASSGPAVGHQDRHVPGVCDKGELCGVDWDGVYAVSLGCYEAAVYELVRSGCNVFVEYESDEFLEFGGVYEGKGAVLASGFNMVSLYQPWSILFVY